MHCRGVANRMSCVVSAAEIVGKVDFAWDADLPAGYVASTLV
jgi:hypothetical protein